MNAWHDVSPDRVTPDSFVTLIEISKASKNKYELDKTTGLLILDRVLYTSTHYPQNYGFIPRTYCNDYDPLDVLVLCSESILPMALVECSPIGVLIMKDGGLGDEKIIAVAKNDPFYGQYKDISEIPNHVMEEIKHFFTVYKNLENKTTDIEQVLCAQEAKRIIQDAINAYQTEIEPVIKAERKARGY